VTHSRYAIHPPPTVFLHAMPSRAEVSRAEARQLLRGNKQLWQRCVTTPVNTEADNRRQRCLLRQQVTDNRQYATV
jgi:hypothetical protein